MNSPRRPSLSLDGRWQLELVDVPDAVHPPAADDVEVPGSWTLQVPGCEAAHGTVRYARSFEVPKSWPSDGTVVLRFGAVNHSARVVVNDRSVASHLGGWTPFEVVLDRDVLTGGQERLEVVVSYPPLLAPQGDADFVGLQEIPHGKQTWYGTNAGIWQPVVLEHRPAQHLAQALLHPDAAAGRITAAVTLSDARRAGDRVEMTVRERIGDSVGRVVARASSSAEDTGGRDLELSALLAEPRLWSPDAPNLYDVAVELFDGDGPRDSVTVTTGLRTVATKDGRVLLNGEPVELRGVLDQDIHPDSALRAGDGRELEDLFAAAKRMGFNLLRCHIKRPDPVYFEIADRLGLMVWAELPSWQRFTPRASAAAEALLEDMIRLDGHHPSIVAWTVVNESWGVDVRDPDQRAWLRRTQQRAKELAPESLVVDNSACESNFHVRSDLDDFHAYRGIPERRASWDAWVDEFAARADWTFSPYGDAERTGEEPLVVSEFGNWGLPDMRNAMKADGTDPWWAEAGLEWAFGAAHASGVVARFERLGLADVFGSWPAFVDATQRQQLLATRYQIGSLRRRPEIAGYVLTQLSDVQWEANGLFDMDRRPRAFADEVALINGAECVVLRPAAYSGTAGGDLDLALDLVAAPDGAARGQRWQVRLTVDGAPGPATTVPAGTRSARVECVVLPSRPGMAEIRAELLVDGAVRARDVADIAVLPPVVPRPRPAATDDPALAAWLPLIGVPLADRRHGQGLFVTRRFDEQAQAHARAGGRVLVIAEDREALGGAFAAPLLARLSPREGDGDWVPRFDWIRRRGPLASLPGGPLLDLAYEHVIGELVIDFLPAPLRPAHLHSAVFAGWLQHRASTTITVPWSAGAVTITTFRLRTAGIGDSVAVALSRAVLDVAEQ